MNKSIKLLAFVSLLVVVFISSFSGLDVVNAVSSKWGLIANSSLDGQKTKGILLFAGSPNNNLGLYTRHPIASQWNWQSDSDVDYIFDEIKSAGVNTIKLSWWGGSTERQWSPTNYTNDIHKQVFTEANERNIMVAPMLEVSPSFQFWKDYPTTTSGLTNRIKTVLSLYGDQPNWLEMYDQTGSKRKVIWLIETIHVGPVDTTKFANTFDKVANKIYTDTGYKVGFVIDPTPLPPGGSYAGPVPYKLKTVKSILAINPFNITSDGTTEDKRLNKATAILSKWKSSGIPLISCFLPGFDDHIVRKPYAIYGDNDIWRQKFKDIALKYNTVGVTLDTWNGFTEGYAFAPTSEYSSIDYELAKSIFSSY